MKIIMQQLLPFVGKHWLRISVLVIFIGMLNQKQIDFSIQLGNPEPIQYQEPKNNQSPLNHQDDKRSQVFTEDVVNNSKPMWIDRMNIFSTASYPKLTNQLDNVEKSRVTGFVRRFHQLAQKESQKFGVPASIILANALLQSGSGTTLVAKQGDNLFSLACTNDWTGLSVSIAGKCYRKYDNAWTSFRDHSLYVTTGKFTVLNQLATNDYKAWAKGLDELEFNDVDQLEEQLIHVVEKWQLFQFD